MTKLPDGSNLGIGGGSGALPYSFPMVRMICEMNHGYPWQWTDLCALYQDEASPAAGWISYAALSKTPDINQDAGVVIARYQAGPQHPATSTSFACYTGNSL